MLLRNEWHRVPIGRKRRAWALARIVYGLRQFAALSKQEFGL